MNKDIIEEIKEILLMHYELESEEDYDYECGCYVNGIWLSISEIIDTLERGY